MPAIYADQIRETESLPAYGGIPAYRPLRLDPFGGAVEAFAPSPLSAESWKICSYDDIVTGWVEDESVSPSLAHIYRFMPEALRAKIEANAGRDRKNYTAAEIAEMREILRRVRGTLLAVYNVQPTLSFYRAAITVSSLKKFDVIKPFIGNWPNFGSFAAHELVTGKNGLQPAVEDMLAGLGRGQEPQGCPIAVIPAAGAPVLIEGYKRALFAMQRGKALIDMFFCVVTPPAALV